MRVNNTESSICSCCKTPWLNTRNMVDYKIGNIKFTLCYSCSEKLFQKSLKISCMYNSKIKTKTDQERIVREGRLKDQENNQFEHMSVAEALRGM